MKYLAYLALMLPFIVSEAKTSSSSSENVIVIELKDGPVVIETFPDVAPKHVERIEKLAKAGKYDGVAFHRVIEGFMAQTGDVEFGNVKDFSSFRAGTGGSEFPDLKEEFNDKKHVRGTCSMARSSSPNSVLSIEKRSRLETNKELTVCTVWGQVIEGMEHVDKIKLGSSRDNGSVTDPDHMIKVTVGRPTEDKKDSEKK